MCRPAWYASANSSDVRDEEQRHPRDEPFAIHLRREGAVGGDEHEEQQRLPGRRVALHLGAALREDEHLASRLELVVRGEDQEHQQRHEQRGRRFFLTDVGDGDSIRSMSVF